MGIAILVYHHFFKALGIILFAVEIIYFLTLPIVKETIEWWKMRKEMKLNFATLRTLVLIGFGVIFLFFPWKQNIDLSAILRPKENLKIFVPFGGEVVETPVARGSYVQRGDPLLIIQSDKLDYKIREARLSIENIKIHLQRVASGQEESREKLIYEEKWQGAILNYKNLIKQKKNLSPIAEISGEITEFDDAIKTGSFVTEKMPIGMIAKTGTVEMIAYITEKERVLITQGSIGKFFPDAAEGKSYHVRVIEIENANTEVLTDASLASINGGKVLVRQQEDSRLIPDESIYKVYLSITDKNIKSFRIDKEIRGIVRLKGKRKSHFASIWNEVLKTFVRETSF